MLGALPHAQVLDRTPEHVRSFRLSAPQQNASPPTVDKCAERNCLAGACVSFREVVVRHRV